MRGKGEKISKEMQNLEGRRLREFREVHPVRTRLPEELWKAATLIGKREGVYRTARTLRLDYTKLRRRAEGSSTKRTGRRTRSRIGDRDSLSKRGASRERNSQPQRIDADDRSAAAAFVELLAETNAVEYLIEVEGGSGGRMRVRIKMSPPEVMNLDGRGWVRGQA